MLATLSPPAKGFPFSEGNELMMVWKAMPGFPSYFRCEPARGVISGSFFRHGHKNAFYAKRI